MKKYLLLFFSFFFSLISYSQDFSNKGKDFWVGYGNHIRMFTPGLTAETMEVYLTSDVNTTGNITIASIMFNQNFTITANQITTVTIPRSAALLDEGLYNHGIHITAQKPIVSYGFIYVNAISGATLFLPTNTLGKNYYSLNYTQISNEPNSYSYFFVEAVDTGTTTVEITPRQNTKGGWPADVTQTINLKQGQIYQVLSATDLTGSTIKSIAGGNSGCKKIAVFCGSGKISIGCAGAAAGSSDNLYQQMYPASTWGKKYVLIPTINSPANNGVTNVNLNYYRIYRPDPTATVYLNGSIVAPGSFTNNYYQFSSASTNLVDADKPILVSQYFTTQSNAAGTSCGGNMGNHDPEMVYLNPVEQTLTDVTLNSMQPSANTNINQHYLNVVLQNSGTGVSSFRVDGLVPSVSGTVLSQDNNYVYMQIPVAALTHRLTCDSGFNAIAYGFGNAESYGYSAGTNLRDLYTFITPINPLNISNQSAACSGTPFYLSITYPFQPISLYWNFWGYQASNVTVNSPVADTTYFINGKQVWRYKLPKLYTYSTAGNYPVAITAGTSGSDGCGTTQTRDDTIYVFNPPIPKIGWLPHSGCVPDSVSFRDSTVYPPAVFSYKWFWDFGDGKIDSVRNPKHKYLTSGSYNVRFSMLTSVGCFSDTARSQITITEVPSAKFGHNTPVCAGLPVIFSDSSFVRASGILTKWYWNYGDGTYDTLINNKIPPHTFAAWGNKNVKLKVQTNSGCQSLVDSLQVYVGPIPFVNFITPAVVCLPFDSAHFLDASTIADASQAGFIYKWHFGNPASGIKDSSVLKNPAHLYPDTGPFNIKLRVTSNAGCVYDTIKAFSTLYPQAHADFTLNVENCVNDATPFTSIATGSGSLITEYHWNFGDGNFSTAQNPSHIYLTSGTKTIKHWIVTEKGCYSDTTTHTVIITPLPTANFTFNTPSCETKLITFADASLANSGTLTNWSWNFGDGNASTLQNPTHIFAVAGSYNVTLSVTSNKGCVSVLSQRQVVITPQPKPGFIGPKVCLSDAFAQFVDTSSIASGSIINWTWNFGDPGSGVLNKSTLKNPQHRYNAIGNYTAKLMVTSNNGCIDSIAQTFTVNGDIPVANFNPLNPASMCANDSVSIQDASSVNFGNITKVEIYWDNVNFPSVLQRDDLPTPGKIYKHLYANFQSPLTKTFTIKYRAYSGATCINERVKTIVINAAPKVQFNTLPNVCFGARPYQITQAFEVGGVPGQGVFSGSGVSSSGIFDPSAAGVGAHLILFTFVSSAGGCIDTASQPVTVYQNPGVNAGQDGVVLLGGSITLQPTVTGSNLQYLWSWNNSSLTGALDNNKIKNPLANPLEDVIYTLTVTGTGGCTASDDVFIKVLLAPKVPNTFSPNNDGINDLWEIKYLDSYPNNRVQVFTRAGQKIFESRGYKTPWNGTMNGKPLPVDTYYYIIEPENGRKPITGYVTIIK